MDPSSLQCHALRAHGHVLAAAVVDAVQATAAEDAAEKQTNARSTPAPTLTEVAVQAVPQVLEANFQVAGPGLPNQHPHDLAGPAHRQTESYAIYQLRI